MTTKLLPPPGAPPRRLTPPEQRRASSAALPVEPDAETPKKALDFRVYQALLSVFDEMTTEQRVAFVDFAFAYAALDDERRKLLLDLAIEMNGLA